MDRRRRAGSAELPLQGWKRFYNPDGFDADSDDLSDQARDGFGIAGAVEEKPGQHLNQRDLSVEVRFLFGM